MDPNPQQLSLHTQEQAQHARRHRCIRGEQAAKFARRAQDPLAHGDVGSGPLANAGVSTGDTVALAGNPIRLSEEVPAQIQALRDKGRTVTVEMGPRD